MANFLVSIGICGFGRNIEFTLTCILKEQLSVILWLVCFVFYSVIIYCILKEQLSVLLWLNVCFVFYSVIRLNFIDFCVIMY